MIKKKPTLLVVDDEAVNIDFLIEALGDDYTVRVATDGAAALQSVIKTPPDLIIMDVMMPVMDGFEVCRRLKDDPVLRYIPIIFLTALDDDAHEVHGLELGAVDYIAKPFDQAVVKIRVSKHLELKKRRSWQDGINRIFGLVIETVPFEEKMKRIADGVIETFGADFCRIWIIHKGDQCSAGCMHAKISEGPHCCQNRDKCLHLTASSGRYGHIDGKSHRRVPFGAYKIGLIASGQGTSFVTNDVQRDPHVHDHEWAKSVGLVGFAGYQLRPPDGDAIGVLALFTKFEISPEMDVILEGLSHVIALVIQKDNAESEIENLRKHLEESLHREIDVYKTLAEKSFTGVFVVQDGLFVFITGQAAKCFGYDAETLIGTEPERIVFPEDQAKKNSMSTNMVNGSRTAPFEYRTVTQDNQVRWIMETVSPISFNDRPAILGNCIDITERRHHEVLQLHSQKLESVGQLAAGIAHEINTPIQFIGDNIQFIKDAFQDILSLTSIMKVGQNDDLSSPAVANALLSQIKEKEEKIDLDFLMQEIPKAIKQSMDGLQRVHRIIKAMREFSHPGSENKTDMDINNAIESTVTLTRNEWKYSADLTTNLSPDLPIVQGYPVDFNQVILNIIVNAAQALQEKIGKEGAEKGRIEISTRQDGSEVEIFIRDTGPGIPLEIQPRIFDPFFTTKAIGKGTGQGLAIAQNIIVRKHGGKIFFETRAGEGTTFYIRLPLESMVDE
jgi:PAS domain S-box-containing protein